MRPMWYATHAVVDKAESDPEFAKFVHESEEEFKRTDFSEFAEDAPITVRFYHDRGWHIWITTNWDRSKTTISFPGEELDDE